MPMEAADIERLIRTAFPDAVLTLIDTAGDKDHYELTVKSAAFQGKSRVEQHRMVFEALGGAMDKTLHALAVKTAVKSDDWMTS